MGTDLAVDDRKALVNNVMFLKRRIGGHGQKNDFRSAPDRHSAQRGLIATPTYRRPRDRS